MHMEKTWGRWTMRAIPAFLLVGFGGVAQAAGFQLWEQNASGIGNAYAGSAAVAENASTIFFNPAGMTQLQDHEISFGVAAVRPSFEFSNQGSVSGVLTGNGGDAGDWAGIPNAYISWALNKDVYLGLGLGAPFGLVTEYDNPWVGAAQAVKFQIKTYNVNPSIAWRVNDKVSLGAGVSWQKMDVEYSRLVAIGPGAVPGLGPVIRPLSSSTAKLEADDTAWGWNVGALFNVSPTTKVGVSYRSKIKYTLDGTLSVSGPDALLNAASSSSARADVELPDMVILSAAQKLGDRWEMLGDLSWTGWSSIPKVDIVRSSGPLSGTTAQSLATDFRDTWRVAFGGTYLYSDAWKLKFGIAFDQSPVKSDSSRLVSLPDNNRLWLSLGAQWHVSANSRIDFGGSYIYVKDTHIDNNQLAAGRGQVTGDYNSDVWLLGAQYSTSF